MKLEDFGRLFHAFESLALAGRGPEALGALDALLGALETGFLPPEPAAARRTMHRVAAAYTSLAVRRDVDLPPEGLLRLHRPKAGLAAVFRLSAYGGAEHLLRALGPPTARDAVARPKALERLLPCLDLEDAVDAGALLGAVPEDLRPQVQAWAFAALAGKAVLHPDGHARREALLGDARLTERLYLDAAGHRRTTGNAWMYCSYAHRPDKHAFKERLNAHFAETAPVPRPGEAQGGEPPTVIVPLEVFKEGHAMFRCYAAYLRQLASRFRLVLVAPEGAVDRTARELGHAFIPVEGPALDGEVGALAERLRAENPVALYYPSLGMAWWCVRLALTRVAPMQCLSLGHPASSRSPHMDYIILGRDHYGGDGVFSERAVFLRGPGSLNIPFGGDVPAPSTRGPLEPGQALDVAVPARSMKLSHPFLALLARLARRAEAAGRPLRFHFFPNELGLALAQVRRGVHAVLPPGNNRRGGALVHPRTDYGRYMVLLAACRLHLTPFPFGGSNSTVDSLQLGLPVVTLSGPEPAARTDQRVLGAAGAPDWWAATDLDGYEAAALRLATDDAGREALSAELLARDVAGRLYRDEHERFPTDFADTFSWVLRNHPRVGPDSPRLLDPSLGELPEP